MLVAVGVLVVVEVSVDDVDAVDVSGAVSLAGVGDAGFRLFIASFDATTSALVLLFTTAIDAGEAVTRFGDAIAAMLMA